MQKFLLDGLEHESCYHNYLHPSNIFNHKLQRIQSGFNMED